LQIFHGVSEAIVSDFLNCDLYRIWRQDGSVSLGRATRIGRWGTENVRRGHFLSTGKKKPRKTQLKVAESELKIAPIALKARI
jgi:hypothetical protein